jgi:nucleoside-diphosphate-sugar epimerase
MTIDKSIFIFGYGYSAAALTKLLLAEGWKIGATSRNIVKRQELMRLGIKAYDFPDEGITKALSQYNYLLISIPPTLQGDSVIEKYASAITQSSWKWVGLLSSTGVYGDHQGAWVDETTPLPENPRGHTKSRIHAERSWLNLNKQFNIPVHVFRLAGIYGAGRGIGNPNTTTEAIYKEGQYFSRIHVKDIAHALMISMQHPRAGAIYNLCDDEPAPRHEVAQFASHLLGLPAPTLIPFENASLEGMAAEFWKSNKRVSNKRLKQELAYSLHYPSYKEGLTAIFKDAHKPEK